MTCHLAVNTSKTTHLAPPASASFFNLFPKLPEATELKDNGSLRQQLNNFVNVNKTIRRLLAILGFDGTPEKMQNFDIIILMRRSVKSGNPFLGGWTTSLFSY